MTSPLELERRVADSLRCTGLSRAGVTLIVACSGGPDSTALLRCLHRLRNEHDLTLHVAHLNHDFRGAEADQDAAFVQRLADGLGLPCSVDKRDPIAYQQSRGISSFEQAAREMRYQFLGRVAQGVGAPALALGHTSDDQAETVLMHIIRGSGLQGLRGMTELAQWPWPQPPGGPSLFRPLLSVGKSETAAYCRQIGQTYRRDSGNYMWRFTRNKVRLDLLPRLSRDYNPRVREALLRLSRAAADEADFADGELERHWPVIADETIGEVTIDAVALGGLHPALQRRALRRAYSAVAGDERAFGEAHVESLKALVSRGAGGHSIDLPRGVIARLEGGGLCFGRPGPPASDGLSTGEFNVRMPWVVGKETEIDAGKWRFSAKVVDVFEGLEYTRSTANRWTAFLNREAVGESATIRTRRDGDRFQPSGMTGTKKLQDFFTDAKVPRERRDAVPLLVCERGIAWVVGHRVAEWAKAVDGAPSVRVTMWVDA